MIKNTPATKEPFETMKMMPGEEPYTPAELTQVRQLIDYAAKADVTERDEVEGVV